MFIHTTGRQVVLSVVSYNRTDPQILNRKRTTLTDNGSDIRPLGYHFRNRLVYFGDVSRRALYRGAVTSSEYDFVEHTVNVDVKGMCVDADTAADVIVFMDPVKLYCEPFGLLEFVYRPPTD